LIKIDRFASATGKPDWDLHGLAALFAKKLCFSGGICICPSGYAARQFIQSSLTRRGSLG
jgi:hypothetical protein